MIGRDIDTGMFITPNHLTFSRMAMVPLIALLLCVGGQVATTLGLILFIIAGLTDWLDGYMARKHNAVSIIGRVFDPISDKLLVGASLFALAYTGKLASGLIIPALAIMLREVFISGLRESVTRIMLDRKQEDDTITNRLLINPDLLASTQIAKLKNVVQLVAIGCLIPADFLFTPFLGLLGGGLLWVASALTVFTGWQYWQQARGHLRIAKD